MDPRLPAALGQLSSFPDLNPVFSWESRDDGGCGPRECVGRGFRVIQWDSVIRSPRPLCGPHPARVLLRCKWCVEAPSCPSRLPPSGFMSSLSENTVSWEDMLSAEQTGGVRVRRQGFWTRALESCLCARSCAGCCGCTAELGSPLRG